MPVLTHIGLLAACRAEGGQGETHPIPDAALAWEGDTIRWVGSRIELPSEYAGWETEDAGERLVIPGLIDCHTHLAFGGWRAGEWEARIGGATYAEIAGRGGGIMNTVRQTRALSEEALRERAVGFLREMVRLGVTTVECKSGYGLSVEDELRILRVYRDLARAEPVRIVPTLLGAHAVPPEYRERRAEYVRLVCEGMIPRAAAEGLAEFCDVFVEEGAFTPDEAREVLRAGTRFGLRPKLHADQLSDGGGSELAAEMGTASADHLEHASEEGIRALARSGTVAVSLPIASLYLGQPPMPARRLIDAEVPVAVATDFNPGTAPSFHLPLALLLACTLQRMTPAEALKGATSYAARAVGRDAELGSLEPGKRADFVVLDAPDVAHWLYHFRGDAALRTTIGGVTVWSAGR